MFAIFRHIETNELYFATDSGCSCPSPFEDIEVGDLTHIVTVAQFEQALKEWNTGYDDKPRTKISEIHEAVTKVKEHLEATKC